MEEGERGGNIEWCRCLCVECVVVNGRGREGGNIEWCRCLCVECVVVNGRGREGGNIEWCRCLTTLQGVCVCCVLCRSADKRGGDSDSDEDSEKSKLKSQLEGGLSSVSITQLASYSWSQQ